MVRPPASTLPDATLSELAGIRYLHLDSVWVQGAMKIARPQVVVLEYVQRMLAALLWLPAPEGGGRAGQPWVEGTAVQLGLGAGALTRFTAAQLAMPTTVVELNPQVVAANQAWFQLPASCTVVRGDALDWLEQAEAGSVRLLFVDLYDEEAAAPVLDSGDFYRRCRQVLAPDGGVLAVNLFGRKASFAASLERIAAACGFDQVWSLRPTKEGNTVVVAGRGVVVPERAELERRAACIESRFGALGLPARKWLRMVRPHDGAAAATESSANTRSGPR
jgi:spermidine synthase